MKPYAHQQMTLLPCQADAVAEFKTFGGKAYMVSPVGHGKTGFAAGCFRESIAKYPAPCLYLTTKTAILEQVEKFRAFGVNAETVPSSVDKRYELWKNTEIGTVYVTTLEAVQCKDSEWKLIKKVDWGMIGIDESDRLTAGASKRNRRLIGLKPRHRQMMTGTELRNGLVDVFFPVMWLYNEPPWKNWTDFRNKELLFGNPNLPQMITGIRDENYLASLLSKFTIEMINPDAPSELVPNIISVPLGEEQRSDYEELKKNLLIEAENGTLTISNHAVLNGKLRQLVSHPKAIGLKSPSAKEEALLKLLPTLSGKTCIFTSFATVATILGEKYGWTVIQGSVSQKKRKEIADSEPDILVCTSAGERGIDLEWLTNVISIDLGFTSATLRQRAGRATRYGRKGEAYLYLFQSPNTVDVSSEEKIVKKKLIQARKLWQQKTGSSRR